jgi:HK97 family phage portal protein
MGWLREIAAEWRALWAPLPNFASPPVYALPSSSGEPVSLDRALGLTTTWACVTLIAGAIASMPLLLYRRLPDDTRERAIEHPLYDVLRLRPNPQQSPHQFWDSMVVALLLRGNAFAQITRDDDGRVRALWFVNPSAVSIEVQTNGRLRYRISPPTGASVTVPDGGMLHLAGPLSTDGLTGRSVITVFRETFGLALAQESYAQDFLASGATPRGILHTEAKLSAESLERLSKAANTPTKNRTRVFEEGLQWTQIGMDQDDQEFIEGRRFQGEEICRIFGVPGHLVGLDTKGSLTYSNSELEALHFLKFCLGPHLSRIAGAVNLQCVAPLERRQLYAEHVPDALLQTSTGERYAAYKTGLEAGFLTVEEVRKRENLGPLPERIPEIG